MKKSRWHALNRPSILWIIPAWFLLACLHPNPPASTMNTDTPGADTTLNVHVGDTFNIRLRAAAGQGYSWQLTDTTFTKIRQAGKQTFEVLPDSKAGSDGIQNFPFKALKTGHENLTFIYVQPYNKPFPSNAPRKTYHIHIQ